MTTETVNTVDGVEVTVKAWTCPDCKHVQDDTVHPELGPYISVTCGNCGQSFSDEQLSEEDRAKWNDARDFAESLSKEHHQR